MTREERLAKLRRNGITVPAPAQRKAAPQDLEQVATKPVFGRPVDLSESLRIRGKNYIRSR
jgi:hypothetical protein